jgi:hypothetical protein
MEILRHNAVQCGRPLPKISISSVGNDLQDYTAPKKPEDIISPDFYLDSKWF